MQVIKYNGTYRVIDSKERLVTLSKPLNKLEDIFTSHWLGQEREYAVKYTPITIETGSFKALKHAVAGYLLSQGINASIPDRYVKAYGYKKELYEQSYI